LGPIGIIDIKTINVSNRFQPFFKKFFLLGSAINLIIISIIKNSVIKISTNQNIDINVSLILKVDAPTRKADKMIATITID
jgi:hypothetical protein